MDMYQIIKKHNWKWLRSDAKKSDLVLSKFQSVSDVSKRWDFLCQCKCLSLLQLNTMNKNN